MTIDDMKGAGRSNFGGGHVDAAATWSAAAEICERLDRLLAREEPKGEAGDGAMPPRWGVGKVPVAGRYFAENRRGDWSLWTSVSAVESFRAWYGPVPDRQATAEPDYGSPCVEDGQS